MLGWLLILVPVALAVHWLMPEAHSLVFGSAALAIIPLAGWMGRATEVLAARAGEGVGPAPMDISLRPGLTLCVVLSVLIAALVAGDGESNWLKGVALLAVYLIFALAFLAVPGPP